MVNIINHNQSYFNSILQSLYHITAFREHVLEYVIQDEKRQLKGRKSTVGVDGIIEETRSSSLLQEMNILFKSFSKKQSKGAFSPHRVVNQVKIENGIVVLICITARNVQESNSP